MDALSEKLDKPIILILTRYFDDTTKLAGRSSEIDATDKMDSFYNSTIIKGIQIINNDNQTSNIDFNTITGAIDFWKKIKIQQISIGRYQINEGFSGKIRQYKNTNIFLYHHWLDLQLQILDVNVVREYVESIMSQIASHLLLRNFTGIKWYIYLHDGDFVKDNKGDEVKFDRLYVNKYTPTTIIQRFKHQSGYLIWDNVLNNCGFIEELIKNCGNEESYLIESLDISKYQEKFYQFLNLT